MRRSLIGAFVGFGLLSGCATQGEIEEGAIADPIEPANRMIFAINDTVDTFVLQPTAFVYKETVPVAIRDVVRNFLDWFSSPVIILNTALQGDWEGLERAASRFVANAPMFGMIDNATGLGLERRPEDFGQTLAVWGVGDGPYIVLPLLGPSNLRDTAGIVADYFADPLNYVGDDDTMTRVQIARVAVTAVDFRAENFEAINDLKSTSVDYYARVRTIYKQRRDALIRNGTPPPAVGPSAPDSSGEFDEFTPSTAPVEQSGSTATN